MCLIWQNYFIQLIRTTLKQVLFSLIILTIFTNSTWSDEKFSDESSSASPDVGFGFESLKSWYDCVPGIQGSIGGKFLIFYPTGSFAKLYSFIFNFEWKSTTKNFYFQFLIILDMTIKFSTYPLLFSLIIDLREVFFKVTILILKVWILK